MTKLTTPHKINIALALLAFAFFVANQFNVFAGQRLDLKGTAGAAILTAFLAVGILVQFGKIVQGHRHWFELVITIIMLAAHIGAEVTIWVRSQILAIGIPATLPLWIVGLYWVVGAIDILALYGPREAALFRGESDFVRLEKEADLLRMELALSQQQRKIETEFAERVALQTASEPVQLPAVASSHRHTCQQCGKVLVATSERGITNAINAHKRYCTGKG